MNNALGAFETQVSGTIESNRISGMALIRANNHGRMLSALLRNVGS